LNPQKEKLRRYIEGGSRIAQRINGRGDRKVIDTVKRPEAIFESPGFWAMVK